MKKTPKNIAISVIKMSKKRKEKNLAGGQGSLGEMANENDYISTAVTVYDRVSKFSELRKHTQDFTKYLFECADLNKAYETGITFDLAMRERHKRYLTYANKLDDCSRYLKFRDYYLRQQVKLVEMFSCQQYLLCPFCASARATKLIRCYHERLEFIMSQHGKKRYKVVMITLTPKSDFDLLKVFEHLQYSLRSYIKKRRDYEKGNGAFCEFSKIDGAVYSIEFTYSPKHGYHPHVHMIAIVSDYIEVTMLSQEWYEITGDSMIVDVRLVRAVKINGKKDYVKGFCEVFKYALKFGDLDYNQIWHIHEELSKNRKRKPRLTGSFGSFWGVKIPESDVDETEDFLEDEEFYELLYRFCNGVGYSLFEVRHSSTEEIEEFSYNFDDLKSEFTKLTLENENQ